MATTVLQAKGFWIFNESNTQEEIQIFTINPDQNEHENNYTENNLIDNGIIYPNGGEYFQNGSTETLKWKNLSGNRINLYVLTDSPEGIYEYTDVESLLEEKYWNHFAQDIQNTGSYTMDPSDMSGTGNAYVILAVSDNGDWDISDGTFSLNYTQ